MINKENKRIMTTLNKSQLEIIEQVKKDNTIKTDSQAIAYIIYMFNEYKKILSNIKNKS